ncbi:hypothetical protein ACN930_004707 [Vibrio parahaemolyticus]|nr:hypothetical protein [Vibrio parahaemolyticus]HCM0840955.1 hypothetical protein [Vibrio parahaemolyticus]
METIYTLNARDHILLELMKDIFGLDSVIVNSEINKMFSHLVNMLKSKGINYQELRNSLTPSTEKEEIILVFDTTKVEGNWYGYDVFDRLLPLFDRRSSHSILVGDYVDHGGKLDQYRMRDELLKVISDPERVHYQHGSQYFMVYVNNLSKNMISCFNSELKSYEAYTGYINVTTSSFMKTYASFTLVKSFIKHKSMVILGHEADLDDNENVNVLGYPFKENNYTVRSINDDYDGIFLTYKIERPVVGNYARDTDFSINAISTTVIPIDELVIEIEEGKLNYLREFKTGRMKKSELIEFKKEELEFLIKERLLHNYFYNLTYLEEHNVSKLNVLIEKGTSKGDVIRIMVSLQYQPQLKKLRLITMV